LFSCQLSHPAANSFNTKDEWGKTVQNNTGEKKSAREGVEKQGNVLKASPGSAGYSLKINK